MVVHAILFAALAAVAADDAPPPPAVPDSPRKSAVPDVTNHKQSDPIAEDDEPTGPRWTRPGIGFGGVPAIAYNPDAGLELGVVGNIYTYDGKTQPYTNSLHLLILGSTKLVQHHALSLDSINVFDLPLRTYFEIGYYESISQAYCGVGPQVTCDDAQAGSAADALHLTGDARDTFLRHYYVFPYIEPYANAMLRLRLTDSATVPRVEALVGYKGDDYIAGTIFDDNHDGKLDLFPFPGSLYARDFPGGESGFLSEFQLGLLVDARDNEPSPRHGYFVEGSIRGAAPFVGSTWTFAGANLTLRGYTPVLPGYRNLVLAGRLILDGIVGDPPIAEMAYIGGSTTYSGYGGGDLGRGIRGQRFLGRVKVLEQQELRWHFYEFNLLSQRFGLILNAFLDAGYVAPSFDTLAAPFQQHSEPILPIGFGGAFLISWNESFIIRLDVASSSVEGYGVYPYITLGQSF
jgi:hypothetical protein